MKVKELIEELKKHDPEMEVYREDSEWGWADVETVKSSTFYSSQPIIAGKPFVAID